jgi:hypothetical protein
MYDKLEKSIRKIAEESIRKFAEFFLLLYWLNQINST